jgi:hypothetical protein
MADEYDEEEIIEEVVEDEDGEPKPGLLILDMLNENLKDVTYNKAAMISNCRHLAMSDFFHVCIESSPIVPKYRAATEGAQLVKELNGFDHVNHIPKKKDSALDGTTVLDTFRGLNVTHVCVCGTSADLAILATVRDLVAAGFQVFVVKDAITSKNGKSGYDMGMTKIRNEFGKDLIVGTSDLLGEEEVVEDDEEEAEWVEEEVVEEADPSTHMAPKTTTTTKSAPPPSTPVQVKASVAPVRREPPKKESGGGMFGCCGGSAVEDSVVAQPPRPTNAAVVGSAPATSKAPVAAAVTPPHPPTPVPGAVGAGTAATEVSVAPITATSVQVASPVPVAAVSADLPVKTSNVREEPKPGWATAETGMGNNSGGVVAAPTAVAPGARPAKNVPAGYVSGTRKDQEISSGVQERINGLKASGLNTTNTGGRRMKTPRIITDTKESWDKEGNITREITRFITEPDGTKRTEKETLYIPKGQEQAYQ